MFDFSASLPIAATILQFAGNVAQGKNANNSAQFVAAQLDQAAGQTEASSQRAAQEQLRQADLVQSALRARAGGGSTDPTIVRLSEDIAGQGEYRALTALYEGSERAAGMRDSANARRMEGSSAEKAGWLNAAGTIFKAAPSLKEKYGKGGPAYSFSKSGYGDKY